MGLLDGISPVKQLEPCKVGRILRELELDDSKTLEAALADPRWTARALSIALSERGVGLAKDTIEAHMKKTCRCSKI